VGGQRGVEILISVEADWLVRIIVPSKALPITLGDEDERGGVLLGSELTST